MPLICHNMLDSLEQMASSALAQTDNENWDPNLAPQICERSPLPHSNDEDDIDYLEKLDHPLDSAVLLWRISGMPKVPSVHEGESTESGVPARFCRINAKAKGTLLVWAHRRGFRPLIVSQSRAPKALQSTSIAPTLGVDATLPQHRLEASDCSPRPANDKYPVWYFFYGTLASLELLRRLFHDLDGDGAVYNLRDASIRGGLLKTASRGRYKALVDGSPDAVVRGHAFFVRSKEHEDALCVYETRAYEVVRCVITYPSVYGDVVVAGCTFRFRGVVD